MKERPILFSGPMVRAILDGRKTQTRRVVKLPLNDPLTGGEVAGCEANSLLRQGNRLCHYGQPGDHLWCKETHQIATGLRDGDLGACVRYRDTTMKAATMVGKVLPLGLTFDRWRPSIFMPRWASRILLKIIAVRIERLQDISEEDAVAEGCNETHLEHTEDCSDEHCALSGGPDDCCGYLVSAKLEYKALWESINGPGSWEANPWVWVIEFMVVE